MSRMMLVRLNCPLLGIMLRVIGLLLYILMTINLIMVIVRMRILLSDVEIKDVNDNKDFSTKWQGECGKEPHRLEIGMGIIKALRSVMPTASRRICVICYCKNFASLHPVLTKYTCESSYDGLMPFYELKHTAFVYYEVQGFMSFLINIVANPYALFFKLDTNLKCDDNSNSLVGSFINTIMKFSGLTILTMLEEIRKLIYSRFVKRPENSQK
ncbi:hypothetical protein Cgig2_026819 [Carnegiea gigantea]|uniref:Uncharacterized protein n=1 Tax=Carnegiea gigantea TaxID=171969 RepID=A0A9Q1JYV2_9CARY|nr:hypothetical protein Cgig2_026819 [Carnegiea gigantea]